MIFPTIHLSPEKSIFIAELVAPGRKGYTCIKPLGICDFSVGWNAGSQGKNRQEKGGGRTLTECNIFPGGVW